MTTHIAVLRYRDQTLQLEIHQLIESTVQRDQYPHGLDGCHAVQWTANDTRLWKTQRHG